MTVEYLRMSGRGSICLHPFLIKQYACCVRKRWQFSKNIIKEDITRLSILTLAMICPKMIEKKRATDMTERLNRQQNIFVKQSSARAAATEASFVLSYDIIKHNKPFSDGECIKKCMLDVVNILYPEAKSKFESVALSRRTVVRRLTDLSEDLLLQLQEASNKFLCYSLALDESNDVKDMAQLLVFIRGVD